MTDNTVAMVSLTTGDPDDPGSVITALTWLIGGTGAADAFRVAMTERHGKPIESAQPADKAGTDEGLVIFGGQEGGPDV